MKLRNIVPVFALACLLTAGSALAEDNPEDLVNSVTEATDMEPAPKLSPAQRWEAFLAQKGWNTGLSEGGVIHIKDRNLIISSASAFTKVRLGQPGWIESRIVAFEAAEMEAKMKIIRDLSESVETKRSLSLLEHAVWEDGQVNKVKELNDISETLKRIGNKSMALAESTLDSALQKLDTDYDPAKYENKSVKELERITEDLFQRQLKSVAMGTLIGVMPLYSTEEKNDNNEYEILVGVLWSPNLNRLAMNLFNDTYTIPPMSSGKLLQQQIPSDMGVLLGTMGTRVVIDENGQYSILAYAQAQPRRSSPARQHAALYQAKQTAANRARGMLVNFIREGLTLRDSEVSQELSEEFSDMTFGTETIRDIQKKINGKNVKISFSGLRILKEWGAEHPDTGQKVAGAVVAWSPASAAMSKQAAATMSNKPVQEKTSAGSVSPRKSGGSSLESMKVDTSAY